MQLELANKAVILSGENMQQLVSVLNSFVIGDDDTLQVLFYTLSIDEGFSMIEDTIQKYFILFAVMWNLANFPCRCTLIII
jgi:hypothetical protein